jgi:ParB/RepB/Spo0J family partition protein
MSEVIHQLPLDKFGDEPQVRNGLDPAKVDSMAISFKAVGQLQPILVRRVGDLFDPVDGHYRIAAAKRAAFKTIAAILEERELTPGEILQRQLIGNCQRTDLTACEVARGIDRLIKLTGWTAALTATHLGFSESKVSGLRKLLTLPEIILKDVECGKMPVSAAFELARVEDAAKQLELADQLTRGRMTRDEAVGARKAAKQQDTTVGRKSARVIAIIDAKRSVTVVGANTLSEFIEIIKIGLKKAQSEQRRGTGLHTFLRLLSDQAQST